MTNYEHRAPALLFKVQIEGHHLHDIEFYDDFTYLFLVEGRYLESVNKLEWSIKNGVVSTTVNGVLKPLSPPVQSAYFNYLQPILNRIILEEPTDG